ncbi:MAG: hypothetical protein ABIC82_06010 [bacterium]
MPNLREVEVALRRLKELQEAECFKNDESVFNFIAERIKPAQEALEEVSAVLKEVSIDDLVKMRLKLRQGLIFLR